MTDHKEIGGKMRNIEGFFSIALVIVFLILLLSTASAKEIIVDDNSDANFRSIQEAVNNSDGIGGLTYKVSGSKFDYLPLMFVSILQNQILPVNNENSTGSKSTKIIVQGPEGYPEASFIANPISGYAPLTVQFTDRSQNAISRSWDFNNDGNPDSNEVSPVYTYTEPGTYRARLRVNNANGTDLTDREIIVQGASSEEVLPVASFTANPLSGNAPLTVQFTDRSQNAISRSWDFNNDGNPDSNEVSPVYTYTASGTYRASLSVSNANGTHSTYRGIIVQEASSEEVLPVASFTANPLSGNAPLTVQFTDRSQNAISRSWDFNNDGNPDSNEVSPVYTYTASGTYRASLSVSNANGTHSTYREIIVQEAPIEEVLPVANFNANPTSGYVPLSVQFTDSSQNAAAWNWNFGDGTTSSEHNPTHTYSAEGTYTVNLLVRNANGTSQQAATTTITAQSQSSSSGGSSGGSSRSSGSSGGGGAGGSPEPQSNVAAKEISQAFVNSGKSVKFEFPRNATSVAYISFNSKKTAGKTTTIVEMLKGKSTLVSGLPSGEAYKSLNIWVGNSGFATPSNIENSIICFKVEKSWIQDKNISKSSINLYRYNDRKWNQLPTSLLSEDSKYLYFTAQTPGFSPFAIASNSITNGTVTQPVTAGAKIQPENVTNIQPGLSNQNIERNNSKSEAEQKPKQEKNANLPVFGMICMIALVLVAFLFKIDKT